MLLLVYLRRFSKCLPLIWMHLPQIHRETPSHKLSACCLRCTAWNLYYFGILTIFERKINFVHFCLKKQKKKQKKCPTPDIQLNYQTDELRLGFMRPSYSVHCYICRKEIFSWLHASIKTSFPFRLAEGTHVSILEKIYCTNIGK